MLLRIQRWNILLAPTLSMIPLGGFLASGAVGIWGILAPMGALVFGGRALRHPLVRRASSVVFLASGIPGELPAVLSTAAAWFSDHNAGPERDRGRRGRLHAAGAVRAAAAGPGGPERSTRRKACWSTSSRARSPSGSRPTQKPSPIRSAPPPSSSPMSWTSRRWPNSSRRPSWWACSTSCSGISTRWRSATTLEKIKTIGDCYMAAAGIPDAADGSRAGAGPDGAGHARAPCAANGPMGDRGLELRIGINSGPVVAGVIGRKRFLYDLWGDAVNIADRMQTHGTPGRIQVTRSTYELLEGRVRAGAAGHHRGQGQGADGDLVPGWPARRRFMRGCARVGGNSHPTGLTGKKASKHGADSRACGNPHQLGPV